MPPWFLLVAAAPGLPATAAAGVPTRAPIELAAGGWLGMHAPQDPGTRDTGLAAGGRLRLRWEEGWGAEATVGVHPEGPAGALSVVRYLGDPSADLVGLLFAGGGVQADFLAFGLLGGGFDVRLAPSVDLRADARVEVEVAGTAALLFSVGPVFHTPRRYDADADGVPDRGDACPREPEDRDGWADIDGCPDPDNDADGVADLLDGCPTVGEDRDGHQDTDGCPDLDDDADGVFDAFDQCLGAAEDSDGWEDRDGCPDPDNDRDLVRDEVDLCADVQEDLDNFEDDDGCPEPDNDADGVADRWDDAPLVPEVYNGWLDGDGAPDAVPPVVLSLLGVLDVGFGGGMAEGPGLRRLVEVLMSLPGARVVVTLGAADVVTGAAQAAALSAALVAAGVGVEQVEVGAVVGADRVTVALPRP